MYYDLYKKKERERDEDEGSDPVQNFSLTLNRSRFQKAETSRSDSVLRDFWFDCDPRDWKSLTTFISFLNISTQILGFYIKLGHGYLQLSTVI